MLSRSIAKFVATPFFKFNIPNFGLRHCSTIETEYKSEISDILTRQAAKDERRQSLIGTIVSTKCAKSVTVRVIHQKLVPKYDRMINVQKKIMAHDEEGLGKLGDLVRIVPCRPMSRKKRHKLKDIVQRPQSFVTDDGYVLTSKGNLSKR